MMFVWGRGMGKRCLLNSLEKVRRGKTMRIVFFSLNMYLQCPQFKWYMNPTVNQVRRKRQFWSSLPDFRLVFNSSIIHFFLKRQELDKFHEIRYIITIETRNCYCYSLVSMFFVVVRDLVASSQEHRFLEFSNWFVDFFLKHRKEIKRFEFLHTWRSQLQLLWSQSSAGQGGLSTQHLSTHT